MGGSFQEFSTLNNLGRAGFIIGCENRYDFKALLKLVKRFVLFIWDSYDDAISGCSCSYFYSLTGDLTIGLALFPGPRLFQLHESHHRA